MVNFTKTALGTSNQVARVIGQVASRINGIEGDGSTLYRKSHITASTSTQMTRYVHKVARKEDRSVVQLELDLKLPGSPTPGVVAQNPRVLTSQKTASYAQPGYSSRPPISPLTTLPARGQIFETVWRSHRSRQILEQQIETRIDLEHKLTTTRKPKPSTTPSKGVSLGHDANIQSKFSREDYIERNKRIRRESTLYEKAVLEGLKSDKVTAYKPDLQGPSDLIVQKQGQSRPTIIEIKTGLISENSRRLKFQSIFGVAPTNANNEQQECLNKLGAGIDFYIFIGRKNRALQPQQVNDIELGNADHDTYLVPRHLLYEMFLTSRKKMSHESAKQEVQRLLKMPPEELRAYHIRENIPTDIDTSTIDQTIHRLADCLMPWSEIQQVLRADHPQNAFKMVHEPRLQRLLESNHKFREKRGYS